MARWRERRQRGSVDASAVKSRGKTGRGEDDAAGGPRGGGRLFGRRLGQAAEEGDVSAITRWRDRLDRAVRRQRRSPPAVPVDAPAASLPEPPGPDGTLPAAPATPALTETRSAVPAPGSVVPVPAAVAVSGAPATGGSANPTAVDPSAASVAVTEPAASLAAVSEPAAGLLAENVGAEVVAHLPGRADDLSPTPAVPVTPDPRTQVDKALVTLPMRVRITMKGRAASAISRWRERRRQAMTYSSRGHGDDGDASAAAPSLSAALFHDALRLLPALALCVIGIALTYGVCVPVEGAPERLYWRRQIAFLFLGLVAYAVIAKGVFPVSRRTTMRVLYGVCCVALPVLVLVLGRATGNGTRWLAVAGLPSVQPAEFAKLVLLWTVAELVNPDQPLDRVARLRRHLLALVAVAVPAFLVFLERSMGNTALLCLSVGTVLATRWLSWPTLLGLLLAGVLALAPVGRTLRQIRAPEPGINVARLEARQGQSRPDGPPIGLTVREVKSSVAPSGAPGLLSHCPDRFACYLSQDGGWNARQALRCVRIGGVRGCGYRQGSITILGYLPRTVQHTDFIYCVLSESFGFRGALVVLGLMGWLIVAVLWTGVRSSHPAAWSFAVGFAVLLFLQTLVHVGMALRVLPIIGIPLPFVSYGGSFLVTSFAALGLVARYDGPAGVWAGAPVRAAATREVTVDPDDARLCQPDLISV